LTRSGQAHLTPAERLLRAFAIALATVYLFWNAFWLAHLQVPASLFTAFTGLSCPTTGGTRAMLALCDGRLLESLRYNALAVPIAALFLSSLGLVAAQLLRGSKVRMPRWLFLAWVGVLALAWALKLATDPRFW